MSLSKRVLANLQAIPSFPAGSQLITEQDAAHRLECHLTALDRLACAFDRFVVVSQALAAAEMPQLARVADALSKRLTYLLEPISPIEVDQQQCIVQMRSNPPSKDAEGTSYYELLIRRGGEMSLVRFRKEAGSVRQIFAAEVTREVFIRLVSDFTSV